MYILFYVCRGILKKGLAIALATWLPAENLWCWLYPVYYILLMTTRQIEDEQMCLEKYGAAWTAYIAAVPYRIVPYIW